ncbi:hypothetical protein [Aestuariivirga litoralis]|uniref:hypothetical protein n=1 Tax=Aestuariivirga litoralis TaxID=2650924 RepID=UPI0018C5FFB4|nr:hypothetical protein [Aestuariivirga litoralis]MBG1232519.1 hypothetical protein [Aestuariivirga litoralis]
MLRPDVHITELCRVIAGRKQVAEMMEPTMHMQPRKYVERELTLSEMLDDPIVQAVMSRDHVQRSSVEQLFENLRPAMKRAA